MVKSGALACLVHSLIMYVTISFTPPVRALYVSAFERPLLGCQKENIVVVSTLPDHMQVLLAAMLHLVTWTA